MGEGHRGKGELQLGFFKDLFGQTEWSTDEKCNVCALKISFFCQEIGELEGGHGFSVLIQRHQEGVFGNMFMDFQGFLVLGNASCGFVLVVWGGSLLERNNRHVRVRLESFQVLRFRFLEVALLGLSDLDDGYFHGRILAQCYNTGVFNFRTMASDSSFDIVADFNMQELRNAVDQVKREILTRYDFKGVTAEVTLNDNDILVVAPDTMKLKAIHDMLLQKVVNRKLSPKILDMGNKPEEATGMTLRHVIKLIKALDQEGCKQITKLLKEKFPKVKATIQGDTVRVSSKSRDELQLVIAALRQEGSFKVPLSFTNYR